MECNNYFDVTSPVVRFDSLQLLLAIVNTLNWEIEMMDVKGTYLNSDLQEEIHMHQPDGFNDGTSCVLKLHRVLYRLKQDIIWAGTMDGGETCIQAPERYPKWQNYL